MWWPAVAVISGSWVGLSSLTPAIKHLFIYLSISSLILLFLLLWYVHGNTYRKFRYGVHVYFAGLSALFLLGALNASIVSVPSVASVVSSPSVPSAPSVPRLPLFLRFPLLPLTIQITVLLPGRLPVWVPAHPPVLIILTSPTART